MTKQTILSGLPWEDKVGYCRAIRVGNLIEVSGTVAIVDGIIERISKVLKEAGASLDHVIRTRIFTTDIRRFDDIARAHGQFFSQIKPTTGMYGISQLVGPEFLVEIEFTAVVGE